MKATTSYIVCATPRTGSYLLCDALSTTGVAGYPTEHLSCMYQRHWQPIWGASSHADYLARVLSAGTTPNGVFGTKLHRHQLDYFLRQATGIRDLDPRRGRAVVEQLLPNPRWIFLTRRDVVAQAISYTLSMQTNIWWDADFAPAPEAQPRPHAARFDFAQIERYQQRLRTWDRRWRTWFEGNKITPLVIAYEDLTRDLPGTVAAVLDYLGLALPAGFSLPEPRVRRQADIRSNRWMARYTALRAAKSQRTIGAFADLHRNEAMVVCGCGTSLNDLDRTNERVTVGVNDVGRAFTPSYLVVVDGPDRIAADRWEYVRVTNADVLFTNQFLRLDHPFIVRMALRETPEPMLPQRTSVHVLGKPWYSPYVALSVAAHLGGDPIGLIGVDFAEDHFFGATGPYPGTRHLPLVDEQFRILRGALVAAGQRVANLSTRSRVTAFPRLDLMDFDRLPPRTVRRDRRPNLNVVVYDQDASVVNGWLARCIWAETGHSARFVHGAPGGDPLVWPDLDWTAHPEAVREELTRADIVLTASPVLPEHEDIIADHPQVRLRVAGEGPALRLGHSIVPLALPLWSQRLAPDDRDGIYTVMLAPGGHRESLRAAVESAAEAARTPIRVVDVERDTPAEASKLRRRADILIDPGANGTWTWSMAGLAAGSIVVNGLASSSQALQHLRLFAGIPGTPFEHASGDRLALVLRRVLASTPTALKARGTDGRRWIQQHWSFASHWDRWWLPPIAAAFRAGIRDVPDE